MTCYDVLLYRLRAECELEILGFSKTGFSKTGFADIGFSPSIFIHFHLLSSMFIHFHVRLFVCLYLYAIFHQKHNGLLLNPVLEAPKFALGSCFSSPRPLASILNR